MILCDDHCHLTHKKYKNINEVIEKAKKAGVRGIICSGVNTPTNREALEIARKYAPLVKCSLGFYPLDAIGLGEREGGLTQQKGPMNLDEEFKFIKKNKENIAAIGEAGLDYHWEKDPEIHKKMGEAFEKVISFTEKLRKPIIIHSRRAEKNCMDMLESSRLKKVVLHCFEARKNLIKKAADAGFVFSIPANIGKSQQFKSIAEIASINQITSETDGPWLSPIPGEINTPENVKHVVKEVAKIKRFEEEEVANNIWMNFQRIYG